MYVLQDESLYGHKAQAMSPASSNDRAQSNSGIDEIKRHLEGHGRVFTRNRKGGLRRGRGFWTEMSMFVVDRTFPTETSGEMAADDSIIDDENSEI
jgi:hypothetical protein